MALSSNTRVERNGSCGLGRKRTVPGFAGTFYIGEIVGVEPSLGYGRPMSGSGEAGYQVVGIVTKEQVLAANGDALEVETGEFLLSGSGFTVDEFNKIVYAADSSGMFDAHSAGRHAVGRCKGFSTTFGSSIGNNIIVDVASVRSGTSL